MRSQTTAEPSAPTGGLRRQSLFTPFTYTFPREHFQNERERNRAEMPDFYGAKTIQDKLRVMQAAQITAQNMMHNLYGFVNDFNHQLYHLKEAFDSFTFGLEQLSVLLDDVNKMGLKIAEYECEKLKEAE